MKNVGNLNLPTTSRHPYPLSLPTGAETHLYQTPQSQQGVEYYGEPDSLFPLDIRTPAISNSVEWYEFGAFPDDARKIIKKAYCNTVPVFDPDGKLLDLTEKNGRTQLHHIIPASFWSSEEKLDKLYNSLDDQAKRIMEFLISLGCKDLPLNGIPISADFHENTVHACSVLPHIPFTNTALKLTTMLFCALYTNNKMRRSRAFEEFFYGPLVSQEAWRTIDRRITNLSNEVALNNPDIANVVASIVRRSSGNIREH